MTFKKINVKETVFHYIEIDTSTYVLFDSELDYPIIRGSKNRVGSVIKNLNPAVRINYYKNGEQFIKIDKIYDKRKGR
jgi:hypothetical protein